jgi:2-dehydro-3-deoxy-D-arabinonate dehydratase
MQLSRHQTTNGPRWASDGLWLPENFSLGSLLELPLEQTGSFIEQARTNQPAQGAWLAPIEAGQEVWASGVTYQRSREARQLESVVGNVYDRIYAAERPELFFKSIGWRVKGHEQPIRIRKDSSWNVPEPELTLVINRRGEIVGYTAGNDMSSRSLEGENPLYLPQAKTYNGSCALGPAIQLRDADPLAGLTIELSIERAGEQVFHGSTSTANMNRKLETLVSYLFRELSFPQGAFLMTGTGIVPQEAFTLASGDQITIGVGKLTLTNRIGE